MSALGGALAPARAGAVAVAALIGMTLGAPAGSNPVLVVGTVADAAVDVSVPALAPVRVDLDAGFAPQQGTSGARPTTTTPSAAATLTGLGSVVRVDDMRVEEGSQVHAGQVLAVLDAAQQRAQLDVARAAATTAGAQPAVVQARLDEARDAEATLLDRRAEVRDALRTLADRRAQLRRARTTLRAKQGQLGAAQAELRAKKDALAAQRDQLVAQRAELADRRAALQAQLDQLPPAGSVPSDPRDRLLAAIAALDAAIARIDGALAQVDSGAAQVAAGLATLDRGRATVRATLKDVTTGLATIDRTAATARDGLATIEDSLEQARESQRALAHLRTQAEIAARTATLAVDRAREQVALTQVRAPVDGVVVEAAADGDTFAPGARLARIRPTGPPHVTAWLSPDQARRVCAGGGAHVHGDWMADGQSLHATLDRVGTRWQLPPASLATDEVHLMRALEVDLVAQGGTLPTGVPVEISFDACPPPTAARPTATAATTTAATAFPTPLPAPPTTPDPTPR